MHTLTVVIARAVRPRGGRKAMITPGVVALERRQDMTLIKAVARARHDNIVGPSRLSRQRPKSGE
jgi:hypothetical protein